MWYPLARGLFICLCTCCGTLPLAAQELQCRVSVQATTVQGVDRSIFQRLEQDVARYLNSRRWTEDLFEPTERIKCSITILISSATEGGTRLGGTAQVQATRPVYGGSYETVVLNLQDKDFNITYAPFQALDFSEAVYSTNLAALLNYYAYMILGVDYDTFSPGGGIPFYQRAQNMVALATPGGEAGWKASDGQNNRYWLTENLLNNSYRASHDILYRYHREGLDQLAATPDAGRTSILASLQQLQQLFQGNPNVYWVRVFLDAKTAELTNVLRGGSAAQKEQFLEIMRTVDPSNLSTYRQVSRTP
jgi:Domain of unknown function (DUF4835)